MKYFVAFITFFFVMTTFANEVCHLSTHSKIFYSGNADQVALSDFIISSTCPLEVQKKFKEIAFSFKGSLYAEYILKNFSEDLSNFDLDLEPQKMEIQSLEDLLKKHIVLPKNWSWSDIRLLNPTQLLLLSSNESLNIKCGNCQVSGSKNIEITVTNSLKGTVRKEWINANIVIKTMALVAKRTLAVTNMALTTSDFEQKEVESVRPERFFTDLENISFYKLNKPLAQGTPLENTDVTPINLVTTTHPVQVILKSAAMMLSTSAMALRPGKLGDTIQLRNTNSQRTMLGKVVDFNKVLIEL